MSDPRNSSIPLAPTDTRARGDASIPDAPARDLPTVYAPPSDPLPANVGEYKVVRLLGQGGMGRVYEVDDTTLRRRVAVKVMQAELAADPTARERFLREARAQAAVQHDHVAVIYDVKQQADGTPFIVMPLLAGETLAARLAHTPGRPLPLPDALRIGRQIADGLAAAHARGLVHRDVKPANVWLDAGSGAVRVLDFGLARHADPGPDPALTPSGAGGAGTPAYMAPEQASGQPPDARADLFSLGVTLFEMTTGQKAFAGRTVFDVLSAVATHTPPPATVLNPAVPDQLSRLIAGLLEKNPTARTPDTATGVSAVLRLIDADATRTFRPPASPSVRTRRPLVVIAAAVALLVVAVVVWAVTRPQPHVAGTDPAPAPATPPTVAKYTGSVDILVERGDRRVPLSDPRAMPLRSGDLFIIEAEVSPPAYLYLFWIDEKGEGLPVYPWKPGKWGTRPADETPTDKLKVMAPNGNLFQITGDTDGMETIVLLARPARLTETDEQLQGWFAGLTPLATGGPKSRIWFENFDEVRGDQTRSVNWDGVVSDSPPARQQQLLRDRIGTSGLERAITFARFGPKK